MKFGSFVFAVLLPFCGLCQQLETVKFMGQFSNKGNEILSEYRDQFFDANTYEKLTGRITVESKPISFGNSVMLIVSTDLPKSNPVRRQYLLSLLTMGTHGKCKAFVTDNVDAKFEKVADDILIFTGMVKGVPKDFVVMAYDNRVLHGPFELPFNSYVKFPNKILPKSNFKFTDEDAQLLIRDKAWGSAKLKRLLADGSITAAEEKTLQTIVTNGPRFRGMLTQTLLEPLIAIKGTELDHERLWTSLVKMEDSPRNIDNCYSNMDGIPFADGKIIGVTRALVLDKGPKVTYSFAWFNGSYMGKVLFLDSDSRAMKQPDPEVTIVSDRFIKIVSHDGAGKPKTHYGAFSDYDLFLLADLPKDEMGFHRNYLFARYGYKFKNPVYQNYFGVFDWYKPEHDDAAVVSNKMTADERDIVTQLAELEKTTK